MPPASGPLRLAGGTTSRCTAGRDTPTTRRRFNSGQRHVNENLEFHPVADIFPMMSAREFLDLATDIGEHGLREPVWLHHDGRIIDGRNRYLACQRLGIEPEKRTYEGDDSSLVAFVVSLNLHRRHLNTSQRAMVANAIANLKRGTNQHVEISTPTQSQAAELLNVSRESVVNARKVREGGVSELAEAVRAGQVAVSTAATIAQVDEAEQREVLSSADEKKIIHAAAEIKRRKREGRVREKAAKVAEIKARETPPLYRSARSP